MEEAFKIIESKRENRKTLADKIAVESEMVKEESMNILREFDPFN